MAKEALSRVLSWIWIRRIGSSPIVQASIVFPAVGYLLLLNAEFVKLGDIDPRFRILSADSPWRLVLVYYGLAILAVGAIIFTTRCPRLVKQFPNEIDFLDYSLPFITAAQVRVNTMIEIIRENLKGERYIDLGRTDEVSELKLMLLNDMGLTSDGEKTALNLGMTLEYHYQANSRPISRLACIAAFFCGFAVLAIPSLLTFLEVSLWMWKTLRP